VQALKSGRTATLDRPLDHGAEIDLGLPALIPDDYLPDVHTRLVFYTRIAGAGSTSELDELQVEMIDRFGLLPEPAKALFGVTELKLRVQPLGVRKLEAGPQGGRILFNGQPNIDPMRVIKLIQTRPKEFKMDGGDKIRFFRDMEERGKRIGVVRIWPKITSRNHVSWGMAR
jgi:transcription-repair coupling factor (superfamily II helicase)